MNKRSLSPVSLTDIISAETTSLNCEVQSWEEAVIIAGKLLHEGGYVEERYIPAMVQTVRELGPYIVITPNVALPHARPDDGAIKPGMSLVTLKTPVDFGNDANDPVKLVIAFATIDHDAHVAALSKLAEVLGNRQHIEQLIEAKTYSDVVKVLACYD